MQDMTTDIQAVIEGLKNGKRVRCVCDERSDTPRWEETAYPPRPGAG